MNNFIKKAIIKKLKIRKKTSQPKGNRANSGGLNYRDSNYYKTDVRQSNIRQVGITEIVFEGDWLRPSGTMSTSTGSSGTAYTSTRNNRITNTGARSSGTRSTGIRQNATIRHSTNKHRTRSSSRYKKKRINIVKVILVVSTFILLPIVIIIKNIELDKHEKNLKQYSQVYSEYKLINDRLGDKITPEFDRSGKIVGENGLVVLTKVPEMSQFPEFPTGCEIISLQIILKFYGVDITAQEINEKLPKQTKLYTKNGKTYGGNPEKGFLGDPTDKFSNGVYQGPILEVGNKYRVGMVNGTGTELTELLKVIDSGNPVQVWVSLDLKSASYSNVWIDEETGKTIRWPKGFHSLVIVGYDNDSIIVSDPDVGKIRKFDRKRFETVYNFYGKRAIYYEK